MPAKKLPSAERRKSQRRNAKDKVFVLFDRHRTRIGHLIDICQGGLCCLVPDSQQVRNTETVSLVAYGEEDQYSVIQSIPLLDMKLEKPRRSAEKVLKIRLHFAHLTQTQQRALAAFLRMHTGPAGGSEAALAV